MEGLTKFRWPAPTRDFSGADLSLHLFQDLQIGMKGAGVSFFRADFRGSQFVRTEFVEAEFSRSDLPETSVRGCRFEACTFDHFGIQSAFMEESVLVGGRAHTAELSESQVVRTRFERIDFLGSTLINTVFEECQFSEVGLERCTIENDHFYRCAFEGTDLGNQSLLHCTFTDCQFQDVTMDVDVLSTCVGLSLAGLQGVRFTRRGQNVGTDAAGLLAELLARHQNRGEFVEACNVAVAIGDRAAFEAVMAALPSSLEGNAPRLRPLQVLRLARKLLYWNERQLVDPYWLAWMASVLMDRLRGVDGPGVPASPQILEALSLLFPAVQDYHSRVVSVAVGHHLDEPLLGRVEAELRTVEGSTVPQVLAIVDQLDRYASPRLPPTLSSIGGILRFEYAHHRKGSLILEGSMILSGLLFLKMFLIQARGLVKEARLFGEEWDELKRSRRTARERQAPAPSATSTSITSSAAPTPSPIQAEANLQLMTSVATRLVVPPSLRNVVASTFISVEVRQDARPADQRP